MCDMMRKATTTFAACVASLMKGVSHYSFPSFTRLVQVCDITRKKSLTLAACMA